MRLFFCLLCIGIFFSGCEKLVDYYNIGDVKQPRTSCRLVSITNIDNPEEQRILYFYDAQGRPTEISFEFPGEGHGLWFEYDEQGRLAVETASTYISPGSRKYVYEGNSRLPVRDTLYRWYGLVFVEEFEYDDLGRIVAEVTRLVHVPDDYDPILGDPREYESTERYYYDIRGNRQQFSNGGLLKYTDDPHLFSLHPVWQLHYRDFSRNRLHDPYITTTNDAGLPLSNQGSYTYGYECEGD